MVESNDIHDLHDEVEHLHALACTALGKSHPLPSLMRESLDMARAFPPDARMRLGAARGAFYAQHAEQLRRVLNGWLPEDRRPSRGELIDQVRDSGFARCLRVSAPQRQPHGELSYSPASEINAGFSYEFGDMSPVILLIREGTDKAEAMCLLIRLLAVVEQYWNFLVEEPQDIGNGHSTALGNT